MGDEPKPEIDPLDRRIFVNLTLLVAVGAGAVLWMRCYTDWQAAIFGVAGVVGGFFVWKFIPEDRLKRMQKWFERNVLGGRWTRWVLFGIAAAGVVMASRLGTIEVRSLGTTDARTVIIHAVNNGDDSSETALPSGKHVRDVVWVPWIGEPDDYRVKVSGFPAQVVTPQRWRRDTYLVPSDFERQAVLLRPSVVVGNIAWGIPHTLDVTIGKRRFTTNDYEGRSVWIGCEGCGIPKTYDETWRSVPELSAQRPRWSNPITARDADGVIPCEVGDHVAITLIAPNGATVSAFEFDVRPLDQRAFPHVEIMRHVEEPP